MNNRVSNFSPGPSQLPLEVLERIQKDFLSLNQSGQSVMELNCGSNEYLQIHNNVIQDLRNLLEIPDNYKVLLMGGGATTQFSCVPLNLLSDNLTANYLVTGIWSKKACQQSKKYCNPHVVASSSGDLNEIPDVQNWKINKKGAYFYYCSNQTISGVQLTLTEEMYRKIGKMDIVADMSSDILSKPIEVSRHAVIFAGAQKNAGTAGVTIVIVREDLLGYSKLFTPTMLDWKVMADWNSLYNCPPCFSIYVCGLYYQYMKKNGGVLRFEEQAIQKSSLIYQIIDESEGFYINLVPENWRSKMNIYFRIKNRDQRLQKLFLQESFENGMLNLSGHRSVQGLQISLYNGVNIEDAIKLSVFMRSFQAKYQQQMDNFDTEISSLKHNFWQILNLAKSLMARNQVLKAQLKQQETTYNWNLNQLKKTIQDQKHRNMVLQKQMSDSNIETINIVSKEFDQAQSLSDPPKPALNQIQPEESFQLPQEQDSSSQYQYEEDSSESRSNKSI